MKLSLAPLLLAAFLISAACASSFVVFGQDPPAKEVSASSDPLVPITLPPTDTTQTSPQTPPPQPMSESDRIPFMQDDRAQANSSDAPGPFGLLARTLGALLLIVGLIFGAGWGLKRYGGPRFGATQQQLDVPTLSVLSTVSLGERRSLAVVKFGERTLLLGSTQQTITLIAEEQNEDGAPTLPVRRVADMLNQSHTDDSFEHQLSGAEERLDPFPGSWHAPEREGAA